MTPAKDLFMIAIDLERAVRQGDLSHALAGAELIALIRAGTVGLDGDHMVPGDRRRSTMGPPAAPPAARPHPGWSAWMSGPAAQHDLPRRPSGDSRSEDVGTSRHAARRPGPRSPYRAAWSAAASSRARVFAPYAVHHEADRSCVGVQVDLTGFDQAARTASSTASSTAWPEPAVSVSAFTILRCRLSDSMATNTTCCAMAVRHTSWKASVPVRNEVGGARNGQWLHEGMVNRGADKSRPVA